MSNIQLIYTVYVVLTLLLLGFKYFELSSSQEYHFRSLLELFEGLEYVEHDDIYPEVKGRFFADRASPLGI